MGVSISVDGPDLVVELTGADVVWCLKRRLSIPACSVVDVHVEPQPRRVRLGWRWPGAYVPGVLIAGTFYGKLGKTFADVRRGPAVLVELEGARFDKILVQVPDAQATAMRLRRDLDLDAAA